VTGRVLLVDDERDILDPLTYALEREGFDVTPSTDGIEALERARRETFDVLVLDVPDHRCVPYRFGTNHVRTVIKRGRVVLDFGPAAPAGVCL